MSRNTAAWHAINIIGLAIFSVGLLTLNIFQWDEASRGINRDLFYRIMARTYPSKYSPPIGVVLIRDHDLQDSLSWPLPYGIHAQLLRSLERFSPQAIFFDIAFIDHHKDDTLEDLLSAIKRLNRLGIKVYLGAAPSTSGASRPVRKEIDALAQQGDVRIVALEFGSSQYRMHGYPLRERGGDRLTAAVQIYSDACREHKVAQNCDVQKAEELEIWWGARQCTGQDATQCQSGTRSLLTDMMTRALSTLSNVTARRVGIDVKDPIDTPYHIAVGLRQAISGDVDQSLQQIGSKGIFIIGTDLALSRDRFYSPVYGVSSDREWPGVFHHAMMLDNLFTLRGDAITRAAPLGLTEIQHGAILIFGLCSALLVWRLILIWGAGHVKGWNRGRVRDSGDLIVITLLGVTIVLVEFFIFRVSPFNILGMIGAAGAGKVKLWGVSISDRFADLVCRRLKIKNT